MLLVTAQLNWQLAMVALAVSPTLFLIALPFSRRLRREWEEGTKLASSVHSALQEVLGAVRVVVAFGKEDREKQRLMELARKGLRTHVRISFIKSLLDLIVGLIAARGSCLRDSRRNASGASGRYDAGRVSHRDDVPDAVVRSHADDHWENWRRSGLVGERGTRPGPAGRGSRCSRAA